MFALGFRPFYLAASVFATLSMLVWIASYAGLAHVAGGRNFLWHAHEMLYGYVIAVVAGFLLTAVRNWTTRPTPTGTMLALLVALWIAGRVMAASPFTTASALVNAAFPLAIAVAIAIPLAASRNTRNYFFVALLAGFACAILAFHLASAGGADWPPRAGLQAGLDIVLFIMAVVAGRVVPMFTNNGIPGLAAKRNAWVEKFALGSLLALLAADALQAGDSLVAALCAIAALAHAARVFLWQPWRTAGVPLVWILHAAYAWIVVHLAMRALALAGIGSVSLATHALTIGAIGGLTLGMMTRTSRGHTGLPLKADRVDTACYVLVMLAAVVRVFGGLVAAPHYTATVVASGLLWSAAFALFAVRYAPILSRSRADGKPG